MKKFAITPANQRLLITTAVAVTALAVSQAFAQQAAGAAGAAKINNELSATLKKPICALTSGMSTTLVPLLGIIMMVAGGVMFMTGDRQASTTIKAAVIGGVITLLAPTLAGMFFPGITCP